MLAMADCATDNTVIQAQCLAHATKWFTLMKSRMLASGGASADGFGNLIWDYWQPAGPWDYLAGVTETAFVHPNNGYYGVDTTAIVEAYQHGVVFTKADIDALARTSLTSWWGAPTTT